MNIFFTADFHYGHKNIIKYCKRPFENVDEMNIALVNNWNETVGANDTVFHIGDFCFGKNPYKIENLLTGKIIHIKGNHDNFQALEFASIKIERYNIFLTHHPVETLAGVPDFCDLILCGHVHEKWNYKILDYPNDLNRKVPIINVGVDTWNFKPVSSEDIKIYADNIYKEMDI